MVVAAEIRNDGPSDAVLAHYGIKGMRWGKRSSGDSSSISSTSKTKSNTVDDKESDDYVTAKKNSERIKTSGTKALSNKELQAVVNRINLEQQYSKLSESSKTSSAGKEWVKKTLLDSGKEILANELKSYMKKGSKRLQGDIEEYVKLSRAGR